MLRTALAAVSFSGRLSRPGFWSRVPLLLLVPVTTAALAFVLGLSQFAALCFASVAAIPLLSAGYRRLQDTGEPGADAVAPWSHLAAAIIACNWALQSVETMTAAFASAMPPDGPSGFAFVILYGCGGMVLGLVALGFFVSFLIRITPAVAQTLLPAQSGPNKYGPNPNEVPL